jgi:neutral ceramidase
MKLWFAAFVILTFTVPQGSLAQGSKASSLRAGAAKVDVTPAERDLPKTYEGILDHIYSRAIVLENAATTAALISVDAGGIPDQVWQSVTRELEKNLGIPVSNVLLTATHTHSVPGQTGPDYVQKIVESVRLAKQRLTAARVGYGAGVSYLNVNRNIIDPNTRQWWEGPNYDEAVRQDGWCRQVRKPHRRAYRRVLQLCHAWRNCRSNR